MRLDTRAFAFASGMAAALGFTLCTLAVVLAPTSATAFFGLISHLDLTGIARHVTLAGFVMGLIAWSLGTALIFGFGSWVYNRVAGTRPVGLAQAQPVEQRA